MSSTARPAAKACFAPREKVRNRVAENNNAKKTTPIFSRRVRDAVSREVADFASVWPVLWKVIRYSVVSVGARRWS